MSIPNNFNYLTYLELNKDLPKNFNEIECINHYITFGINEKRKYQKIIIPYDFNYKTYLEINYDLPTDFNENDCINHYINYGYYENRKYLKTIYHIIHNFGGGTYLYAENIINIFKKYNHIIVKIIHENEFIINDIKYNLNEINNILENGTLLIVHSLLYENDGLKLSYNMAEIIKNINYKKILFIHDYFLLYPETPNLIKSSNKIPLYENIDNAIKIFNFFDNIYFNSNNSYYNYLKYVKTIKNTIILNVVPDISYYNERILLKYKNKYNIGLIGEISCIHKGRFLANNIIKLFNEKYEHKYHFYILGTYDISYPNLTVHGKYNNNEIFELIKKYDIDIFLFVSVFEETYSFTLSIVLNTGLPIIYNNIGAYVERLQNYKNCYPYEENNYYNIINILNNIEYNEVNVINEEYNLKKEIHDKKINTNKLYENMPEISKYLVVDNKYNFNTDLIISNLKNKAVCFMHVCNIKIDGINFGHNIFLDQINYIKECGLYNKLDYIFVTLIGEHINLIHDYKIKVIYYSENTQEWEFPHVHRIKYFCDSLDDGNNIKILQIHTKGALNKKYSNDWRKYLEYYLIEKHSLCLKLLDNYYCVGVNHHYYYNNENKYKNHFSGNFWWTNSNYIKNLDQIDFNNNKNNQDRYQTEHWLIGNLEKYDYRYFLSLHHTNIDFYESSLSVLKYNMECIKNQICYKLVDNKTLIKRQIYGVYFICCLGNYLNILQEQINKLINSDLYKNSEKIFCFICLEKDDCLSLLQKYEKLVIISTAENLYEKFAINSYKKYIETYINNKVINEKKIKGINDEEEEINEVNKNYYLYYIHSKSVSRTDKCYNDWRNLCEYFTIDKWKLNIELLEYYDCIGTNLKNFPKKHYSGNFWWSKSEHLNTLKDVNDGYLSPEMYICSNMKTNYVSIYQSYVNHGDTEYPDNLYKNLSDTHLINNICIIPDFNEGDKQVIDKCGNIDLDNEPPIIF